jgi:hypothetical protein
MNSRHLLAIGTSLVLASCSSGSSFDGESETADGGLGLTSADAEIAVGVAYSVAASSAGLTDVGGTLGITATAPGDALANSRKAQLSGYLVNVLQAVPFGPDVFPCAVSGTITISGDLADPLTLTAGDTFNVDSDACDDGIGETVDGLMSMTVTDFAGDLFLGTYLIAMNATLDALQVTTASDVISSSGDASVTLDTTATPFVSASVGGTSMVTSSNASTDTLSNYSTSQTVNAGLVPTPYTLTSSGSVTSSLLDDSVTYSTPVTFAGSDADFPDSGELLVAGNNSSARLVTLDNVNVRIDLDIDGNGSVDETIMTTWAELTN